jgi:hypothetical protein
MDHEIAVKSRASERYLLGELSPEERDEFEAHFFECAACGEEVKSADLFIEGLREALAEKPVAPRAANEEKEGKGNWWTWLSTFRPAFAYAALAAVLVISAESYWIFRMRGDLAEAAAPRLLASAVLRPETRGEPTRVYAPAGAPVLLTFDVVAPHSFSRYLLRIETAAGEKVLELAGAAPPAEKPVSLSLPGGRLAPGRYTMTVNGIAAAGQTADQLGRYHFEVFDKEEPAR